MSSSKLSEQSELKSIISFIRYDYNLNALIAGEIKFFRISSAKDLSFSQHYKKFNELLRGVLNS